MSDKSDGVGSEESLIVHSLVPVAPVLNYAQSIRWIKITYLPFMLA
jgi:hypothetical protein